jgi:molybdopterin-binding protein
MYKGDPFRRAGTNLDEARRRLEQSVLEHGSVACMRLSARNQLEGTVVSVKHGDVMSTVVIRLSGGQDVVSAITKDSAEGLSLAEGDAVTAVIKATEVMIGKD